MNFDKKVELIRAVLKLPLPGEEAQFLMAPKDRKSKEENLKTYRDYRLSSVMMLLYPDTKGELCTLFIERPVNETVHSGQLAFPGGKAEPEDATIAQTALRETEEEIGIPADSIEILGELTTVFIPASNFLVHPHIGLLHTTPVFNPNPDEVKSIIPTPLDYILNLKTGITEFNTSYGKLNAPYFSIYGHTLWGATAMMVSEFKVLMKAS